MSVCDCMHVIQGCIHLISTIFSSSKNCVLANISVCYLQDKMCVINTEEKTELFIIMLERLVCVYYWLTESLSRNVMKTLRPPTTVYPWLLRTVDKNSVRISIQLDFFVLAMKSFCCIFVIIVLLVVLLLWFLLLLEAQRKYRIFLLFRCMVKHTQTHLSSSSSTQTTEESGPWWHICR